METSLRFDSRTKHLCLFAKEKFSNDDNYVLTVRVPRAFSSPERPNPNPRAGEAGGSRPDDTRHRRGFSPSDADAPSRRGGDATRANDTHARADPHVLTHASALLRFFATSRISRFSTRIRLHRQGLRVS